MEKQEEKVQYIIPYFNVNYYDSNKTRIYSFLVPSNSIKETSNIMTKYQESNKLVGLKEVITRATESDLKQILSIRSDYSQPHY